MANSGDPMVKATQTWLNKRYGQYASSGRYNIISEDGYVGMGTINALIRALQIELGIQNTADNFGPSTEALYTTIKRSDTVCNPKFGIVQGALWCKGYNSGHYAILDSDGDYILDEEFDAGVENAVKKLQKDAGRSVQTGEVDLNTMKALLSMDYFVTYSTNEYNLNVRKIQQYLNRNYESYIGLKPCDGNYGRGTNTAMLYALQAEEKLPISVANGNFGPTTKRTCPTIPYNNVEKDYYGNSYSATDIEKFVILARIALYVNGFEESNGFELNGEFNSSLQNLIKDFQLEYALPMTGKLDAITWASMLTSCGDTSRSASACDCATPLDEAKAKTLYNNGYRYVGRYLSGTAAGGVSKALSTAEFEIAFRNGLRIFPIFQGSANYVSYFTENQAIIDVNNAYNYATNLGVPEGTIIYFAVDCDPLDTQITNYIIPYFKKLFETMRDSKDSKYKIGIYGTRNVCSRVSNLGYAVTSFVSDMSTGFSGNLGFKMPSNWAFDQFTTVWVGTGDGRIQIDKDGFSGRDLGISYIHYPEETQAIGYDYLEGNPEARINLNRTIPVYSSKKSLEDNPIGQAVIDALEDEMGEGNWQTASFGVAGNIIGYIYPGEFYIRFKIQAFRDEYPNPWIQVFNEGDSAHKVIFRDTFGNLRKGYIQEVMPGDKLNNGESELPGQVYFRDYNYDENTNQLINSPTLPSVFTVKRESEYKSPFGSILGTLKVGDKIKTASSNTGVDNPTYLLVNSKYNPQSDSWEPLNPNGDDSHKYGFVDLGMKYGVKGSSRSFW